MEKTRKKIYYEWMRILACGLVIYNHLNAYTLYMNSSGIKQGFYMFLTMLTRINVPLFFMISGALLLSKKEDFNTVISKRISRFVLIILIFELGIYIEHYIHALVRGETYLFTIKRFIYGVLSQGLDGIVAYWYLYAYLGFLFMLPFMQRIAKDMKKQDFYMLILLHFVFSSFIPILNIILQITENDAINITGNFSVPLATIKAFFYPLLGYYLEYYVDVKTLSKKKISVLFIASGIGILLSCLCTLYEGKTTGTYTQNYVQLFDYLTTIVAFITIKYIVTVAVPQLSQGKLSKIICLIGSFTFGIYLLDPYLKLIFYKKYETFTEPYLPTIIVSIGWCMISMITGGILTFILKQLPLFKKIL